MKEKSETGKQRKKWKEIIEYSAEEGKKYWRKRTKNVIRGRLSVLQAMTL